MGRRIFHAGLVITISTSALIVFMAIIGLDISKEYLFDCAIASIGILGGFAAGLSESLKQAKTNE